ncbi:DUF6777 domain-containing protein [Geodermatophilus sp. URMC 62]|uniref:DUF6777 domain-containing protein n=1 Tax=Geodermatophilus sp. URMC 62 TaxID=3423414 RepID=UPI00406D4F08
MIDYPSADDYVRAVQHPDSSFADEDLQEARFAVHPLLGVPMPASGSTAVVFKAQVSGEDQALRFFIREDASSKGRYTALGRHLQDAGLGPDVATAQWVDRAIRIREQWYPMIRMQWVEGRTLDRYADHLVQTSNLSAIAALAALWRDLVGRMQTAWFAHGDLQHGNVLVDELGTLRLVDFDCAWIPSFEGKKPPQESGHRNYQRTRDQWGPWMDTFPALVIYLSLLALSRSPRPWELYNEDNLIFSREDFAAPFDTAAWRQLAALEDPEVDRVAERLRACCDPAWRSETDLESVLSGRRRIVVAEHDWVAKAAARRAQRNGSPSAPPDAEPVDTRPAPSVLPPPPPKEVPHAVPPRPADTTEHVPAAPAAREVGPAGAPLPDPGVHSGDRTRRGARGARAWREAPPPRRLAGAGAPPGLLVGAVVLLLALTAVVTTVLLVGSSGTAIVRAEPAPSPGPGPFTPPPDSADPGQPPVLPPRGTVSGNTPGIYGGTGSNACDPVAMATYLETHPGPGRAWARAQGIEPGEIRTYLERLTPVTLRTDTAVTNHDYRDGRAVPVQSILQAGTAVLVDERGAPQVRCACGNPLGPPDGQPASSYEAGEAPWPGFAPDRVTVIEPAPAPVVEFVLVVQDGDQVPDDDAVVVRPRATLGEQDHPASPAQTEAAKDLSVEGTSGPSSTPPAGGSSTGPTTTAPTPTGPTTAPAHPTGTGPTSGSTPSASPSGQTSGSSVSTPPGPSSLPPTTTAPGTQPPSDRTTTPAPPPPTTDQTAPPPANTTTQAPPPSSTASPPPPTTSPPPPTTSVPAPPTSEAPAPPTTQAPEVPTTAPPTTEAPEPPSTAPTTQATQDPTDQATTATATTQVNEASTPPTG